MSVIDVAKKQFLAPIVTTLAVVSVVIVAAPKAHAASIILDFEGVGNLEPVGNFYNTAPHNFGVTFSANASGIVDSDAGGTGNIGGEPSPSTALLFLSGSAATLNAVNGFTTGLSFFYSAIENPGFIKVYDGLNATGNILATLDLPKTPFSDAPDPTGQFSPFVPLGVNFLGTAKSVDFGGTANRIVFDDITFVPATPGDTTPIPTPALLPGLIGLGVSVLRKRKGNVAEQSRDC
jgi:hypothetical protein